ncbi:N/A [soil metagenome]
MFLASATLFLSRRSGAQDGSSKKVEPETVVVTGTRTPEASQRATVKTDVVTRDEAERRGATNVGEARATQPGLQVNPGAYGFLGGVSAIQIQGFDRDRVLILEDGERIVGDSGGAIDLAALPIGDIQRIEVVTGPTSSLYGASAIGGVVNILTAPPRREGGSGRLRLEGRNPWGVVAQGNAAYRSGNYWATADVNVNRSAGIARIDGLPDLQIPDVLRTMVGLRGGFRLSPKVDIRIRGRWFRDRIDGLETQLVPNLGRYVVDLPEETNRFTLHVIDNIDLGRGSSLRFTVGRQQTYGETRQDRRDSPIDQVRDRSHQMSSLEIIGTIADGPRTWVAGARTEVEHFDQYLSTTESTAGGLVTTNGPEVSPQTFGNGAVYGQLQWKFGKVFTLLPGVRGEGHSRYGGAIAPRLALSFRPSDKMQLRLSGGRGFRAPSAKELGYVFDHSVYGYRVIGNADLRPETSWGVNGDVSYQPDAHFLFRVGGFGNWVSDLIDVDLAGGVASGTVTSYAYENIGTARTAGLQLDTTYKEGDHFRADLSYAYLWTRDDANAQPLAGRPAHVLTAALSGKIGRVELVARYRVSSDAYVDGVVRAPPYQTLDVRAGVTLWPKSQLYVGALNLFDVHSEPGRVGDMRPPVGRTLYLGIRAEAPWEED